MTITIHSVPSQFGAHRNNVEARKAKTLIPSIPSLRRSFLHHFVESSQVAVSIVLATADHLFDIRSENESVFKLSSVAPLDITEWRIRFHNS
jgi:hypothetical protein